MRTEGTVKSWSDRGYGWVEITPGGRLVFLHIRDFVSTTEPPAAGTRVVGDVADVGRGLRMFSAVLLG